MPTIDTSTATVAYSDTGGPGPIVLLLHAALHDRADYASVHAALAAGRRVIALDFPGHGESPSPAKPLGAPEFGDVALEFADLLGLTDAVVVGNSVGGYAACRLALERPDRVAGVVLVNTGGFTPHTPITRVFCAAMGRPAFAKAVFPLFIRAYLRGSTAADHAIATRVLARARTDQGARTVAALWRSFALPAHDLRQRGADIAAPVLITWGTRDLTAPIAWGRAVLAAVPGARWRELRTGHVVFASAPDEWLGHVVPFLDEVQHADRPSHPR
jgi:pimeloyl-ACP methyl ester carboxylesterase